MSLNISSAAEERAFNEYKEAREQPRVFLRRIYYNGTNLLREYTKLAERLQDADDLRNFAAYHTDIMADVAPHVQSITNAVQGIIDTIEAIETAAPGTFGIEIEESETETEV